MNKKTIYHFNDNGNVARIEVEEKQAPRPFLLSGHEVRDAFPVEGYVGIIPPPLPNNIQTEHQCPCLKPAKKRGFVKIGRFEKQTLFDGLSYTDKSELERSLSILRLRKSQLNKVVKKCKHEETPYLHQLLNAVTMELPGAEISLENLLESLFHFLALLEDKTSVR